MRTSCENCGHWFSALEHQGYGDCHKHKQMVSHHNRCGDFIPDLQTIMNNWPDPEAREMGARLRARTKTHYDDYYEKEVFVNV